MGSAHSVHGNEKASCPHCAGAGSAGKTVEFQQGENEQQSMQLGAGNTVKVFLPGNPTTGYSWTCATELPNANVQLLSQYYVAAATNGPMVGGGGQEVFLLKAKAKGVVQLDFAYRRPWEGADVQPARTAKLSLTVE